MKNRKRLVFVAVAAMCIFGSSFLVSKKIYREKNSKNDLTENQKIAAEKDIFASNNSADGNLEDDYAVASPAGENINDTDASGDTSVDMIERSYLHLINADCEAGCVGFDDVDDLKYCKEYCGTEEAKLMSENCDELEDLEQDYCYKHQAKNKKDASICQLITDDNIKQACSRQEI